MSPLQSQLQGKLNERSTSDLKNDIIVAFGSEDENANLIFVLGLNVLEERLSKEDYEKFEESL